MKKTEFDYGMDLLPEVVYPDVVNYLLFAHTLLNNLTMDSYNSFGSGFVKEVGAKIFSNVCLPVGMVSHSQKLSETPLTAWVIAEMEGKVLSVTVTSNQEVWHRFQLPQHLKNECSKIRTKD